MVITSVLLGLILYLRTVIGICPSFGTVVDLTAAFDSVGTLTTDHYPIGYYSDSNCRWLIEAQAPNQKVVLFIEDFNTEEDFDFLYIYDGNTESSTLLFSGSGTHNGLWWISSTQYMFIQFTSDYSVQTTGISIKYVSSERTVTGNDTACPYSIFGVVSAQFTMINDETSCIYQVSVPSVQLIRFTMLINDRSSITVYDGNSADPNLMMVQYGSSENTNTYQSTSTAIYINKPSGGKFVMHYERVDASMAAPTIVTSTPSPQEFSCSDIYLTATTTGYGLLASPFWPNHYPNNLQCSATITTTNSTASVQVTFTDVDILHCCDYLELFDGSSSIFPSLGNTWSTGDVVTSTGSSIMLSFYSDSTGSLRGFQLQYLEVPRATPSCVPPDHSSVQASATEYILASPNYPSFYDNNMLEYWLITKPTEEDNIVLDIRNMHLETSFDCSYDKLTIYDGPCTTSPVMAVLCGNVERILQDNSGLYVLVEFRTDGSVTYTGFEIIIYLGTFDEPDDLLDTLKYIIPIAVGAVVLIIVIGLICYYRQKRQKRNQQIVPGSKVIEAQVIKAPPPGLKRKTTHQLLAELQERYGRRDQDMKSKASRKAMERYQPKPGPSGLAQPSYPTQQSPYGIPPPSYVSAQSDPAYPPNFFETSAKGAFNAPIPTVVPSSGLAVASATPTSVLNTNLISVPAAPQYSTPSEARQAGLYG